jgi:hypothetical protein
MTAKTTTEAAGLAPGLAPPGRLGLAACAAAALLSLVAALIHLWVAPEHFEEWWGYGTFMLALAACQGIFVPLVLRFPASRLVSLAGIAGNLFIVVLYVVSYTWGMPFGPTWVPFDPAVAHLVNPEVLGTVATAAEMGIVIVLTVSLEGSLRRAVINALLVVGALLWALRIVGILP